MKKRYWLLLLLLGIIITIVYWFLAPSGYFKTIVPHFDGEPIAMYTTGGGTEDIAVDHDQGILFISSGDRRAKDPKSSDGNGIYIVDLENPLAQAIKPPTDFTETMYFHGISFFKQDSTSYIYAINHRKNSDFIELFKYQNDSLLHIESFTNALMPSPNDIHGVSTTEFYITNDHTSHDPKQEMKEDYLRLANRNIVHYRNGKYQEAANGLAMPNGINTSHDGKLLYATTTIGQEFITYDRDTETGKLKEINRQHIDSGLDNIDVDVDGNIWIGSHPKIFTFLAHAGDKNTIAPSQALKLTPKDQLGEYVVEEMYLNDGSEISASSVAIHYKNDLLIGAVFDKKVFRGRFK